ncbi:MAG: SAM-dependent methyltransferase [Proteobacteria bacterium]|nr:SAM-dependent methyltransferase [Pseudomonadota bacterium]
MVGPIYELGSGWGGLARALARRYPGVPVRGFEVSLLPWAWSRLRHLLGGPPNVAFALTNFHAADLSDAALVVCYLPGPAMEKLRPKLEAELPDGALVLSNAFALTGWRAAREKTVPDIHRSRVYLYRKGE